MFGDDCFVLDSTNSEQETLFTSILQIALLGPILCLSIGENVLCGRIWSKIKIGTALCHFSGKLLPIWFVYILFFIFQIPHLYSPPPTPMLPASPLLLTSGSTLREGGWTSLKYFFHSNTNFGES